MLSDITTPTALLDERVARRNIQRMADKARRSGVRFRPHFKTHQSAQIGDWFRAEGVTAITVSSVSMARYFADHGWSDITIAFPLNVREMEAVNALAGRVRLGILIESLETARILRENLRAPLHVWIEIDAGYHRTGLDWQEETSIAAVVASLCDTALVTLDGLLTHSGHSYRERTPAGIQFIHADTLDRMQRVRAMLVEHGIANLQLSIGDTPTCSIVEDFSGVDEIRPGNFVFYDVMQHIISACTLDEIALAVACPVVAKHPERHEIALYGGAVHLSKDSVILPSGDPSFGLLAELHDGGWRVIEGANVHSLSQEHALVHVPADLLERVQIGDLLLVLPVHSCLTADLLKDYRTLDGLHLMMGRYA